MDHRELNEKYFEMFGSYFPSMCFTFTSNDDLLHMMQECIDKNIPAEKLYDISYANGIEY